MQQETNKTSSNQSDHAINILISRWKDGTFGEIIDDWKWIFTYSSKYKGAIAFYTLLSLFGTTLGLVGSVASKYLIDIVTGYKTDKLALLIAIMVGSTVFNLVFSCIISRIDLKLQIDIHNNIRSDIFDKIMNADWAELNRYNSGDVLNRFNSDVGTISGNAIGWLPSIINAFYRFIATFFVIAHYDLMIAVLALASAPILFLASRFILKKQREYGQKVKEMSSEVMAYEVETFTNVDTIKAFDITTRYSNLLRQFQAKLKRMRLEYQMFSMKTGVGLSLLSTTVQGIAFAYCLWRLWTGQITYGTMTLFLQQRSQLSGAFNGVISIIPSFLNSSISAHRIRELVELPRERRIPCDKTEQELRNQDFELRMSGVDFSYEEGTQIIQSSDFFAQSGEIIALVGPSGEGKTTMIRLILGLVTPSSGTITLSTEDGSTVDISADTRQLFSYVPQGNTAFSGTVAENLRMVKEDATDEELIEVLKLACAWDFVEKMPGQLNAKLGERGRGLSEGQAQRLAIARAFLRNAPILLLDEATSALDPQTEQKILNNMTSCHSHRICILTTHRPSVLNLCDRVYRVVKSHVTVQEGSYSDDTLIF